MRYVPQATLILPATALIAFTVAVVRGDPAFGVMAACCLLAWACYRRFRPRAPEAVEPERSRARGEYAGTHLLEAFDAFARNASPAARAEFERAFASEQRAWQARGRTMPHYVVMALLRRAEAIDRGRGPQRGGDRV